MRKFLSFFAYSFGFLFLCVFFYILSQFVENKYKLLIFAKPTWPTLATYIQNFRFIFLFAFITVLSWILINRRYVYPWNVLMGKISLVLFATLYILFARYYYPYINIPGYEACNKKADLPGANQPVDVEKVKIADYISLYGKYSSSWQSDGKTMYLYNSRSDTYQCLIEVNKEGVIEHYWSMVKL